MAAQDTTNRGHGRQDRFGLAYHEEVIRLADADPGVVDAARARLERWAADGVLHPHYAERWRALLAEPWAALCTRLREESDEMQALRQVSPFAGTLAPRERWALRRRLRADEEGRRASYPETS